MAEDEDSGAEKPFEATPKKLQEARRRGDFPVSQDLVTACVYLSVLLAAVTFGAWSIALIGDGLTPFIRIPHDLALVAFEAGGWESLSGYFLLVLMGLAVWLGMPFIFAIAAAGAQGALIFAPEKLKPKLSRISPVSNAKQKYGRDGFFNFFKSFTKLTIYSVVLFLVCRARVDEILALPRMPFASGMTVIAGMSMQFLVTAVLVMGAISILDFLWQRSRFLQKQRMTLKELRDESKETEGDPHTKQARRQKAYDIATNQMIASVPDADVVVVNPTHYAVALKWERQAGTAPVCVAKGVDEIAARIRTTAIENGVPIYRDAPTARDIHAIVDVGEEIRVEHYRAIAAAIRFAEKIRKKARSR